MGISRIKSCLFSFIVIMFIFGIFEGILQFSAKVNSKIDHILSRQTHQLSIEIPEDQQDLEDPLLGYRGNPLFKEHDQKGFRNRSVLNRSNVVVLGDSQTYGTNVKPIQSWPYVLSKHLKTSVYNMAYPSYGPVQSLHLLDQALAMNPKLVIEAFYFGNDLFDAFEMVYSQENFKQLRSVNIEIKKEIEDLESQRSIQEKALKESPWYDSRANREYGKLRKWLAAKCKTYGLLRAFKRKFVQFRKNYELKHGNHHQKVLEERHEFDVDIENIRTVFTSDYRLVAMDQTDLRVLEGRRITRDVFLKMKERVEDSSAKFMVILIPTKESVYSAVIDQTKKNVLSSYAKLIRSEQAHRQALIDFLNENHIAYIDLYPAFVQEIQNHTSLYPDSDDGHPSATGHQVIAAAVLKRIQF